MNNDKVFAMPFAKVFPLLIAKAEKKGRTGRVMERMKLSFPLHHTKKRNRKP